MQNRNVDSRISTMGPPPNLWVNSQYQHANVNYSDEKEPNRVCVRKRYIVTLYDSFRLCDVNLTVVLVLLQVFISLVSAGPVLLGPHNIQGKCCFLNCTKSISIFLV